MTEEKRKATNEARLLKVDVTIRPKVKAVLATMEPPRMNRGVLEAIRNAPCGRCGAVPPFTDGSRCHPHRVVPGSAGGQYIAGNAVPRCPSCHDIEHGGEGTSPFIGAARVGGRAGGRRRQELHPDLSREIAIRTHKLYPTMAREAGLRAHELHPGLASETMRRTHEKYPELRHNTGGGGGMKRFCKLNPEWAKENGRKNMLRLHESRPDLFVTIGREHGSRMGRRSHELNPEHAAQAARKGNHVRWHEKRRIRRPDCVFCNGGPLS